MKREEGAISLSRVEEDPQHPNELWWRQHGGSNWLDEIQKRLPNQQHYRQQEAFLQGFFLGIPPTRVLDFGCGYGRHIRNLRNISGLELFGCDISEKMLETAQTYLGDPAFAKERLRLVKTRSRLPYEDSFFGVVLTSEVLIHVDTPDIVTVVRELWRVSSSLLVHIENRPTARSQRENTAHGGSWLHNFKNIYQEIGPADVIVLPEVIENQCVYIATKPGSALASTAAIWGERKLSATLATELTLEKKKLHNLRQELAEQQIETQERELAYQQVKNSIPMKLARRARHSPFGPAAAWAAARLADRIKLPAEDENRQRSEPNGMIGEDDLSFAGVATRASVASAEDFVKQQPHLVAICHPEWRGIRAATQGQAKHVLEVPGIVSSDHCRRLVHFLEDCNTQVLVVNGFPPNIDKLIVELNRTIANIQIHFVYHGTPAQFHFREDKVIHRILELMDARLVRKVGFVKSGLAEFVSTLGYQAEYVMNICRLPFRPAKSELAPDGRVHIGVFGPIICHKNVQTQLIAALMLPGTTIHTSEPPDVAYLQHLRERIVSHGILPHGAFLELLGQMHATLCVSLVECYPMTVLESLAAGAVCLTSHTSTLFDGNPDLLEALVVRRHDNPYAIARQLARAIENRATLIPRAQAYISELNEIAEERWRQFLEE